MDLTGIGVLLIGIAFLILAIFLAKVLNNLGNVLGGVGETIEQIPEQLDNIMNETGNLIHHSNETLSDVNEKLGTLTPIFHIVGDLGETTRKFSSSMVDVTASAKKKIDISADEETQNKRLGGIYGTIALGYYSWQKKKEIKKGVSKNSERNLYQEGKVRALEIENTKK